MSETITAVFLCLVCYRFICAAMDWQPFPLVQITINNTWEPPADE